MISSEVQGLLLLLFSLCCLGTWPALLRLCSYHPPSRQAPTESFLSTCGRCGAISQAFFRDGGILRNICHVYMDYATAYFLTSSVPLVLALAATGNEIFASMPLSLVSVAMLGGALLSYGNLSLQWATSIYGAPLTTTLAIQASLTVVLGTFLNFALEPSATNHPDVLALGVIVFLVAISLAAKVQMTHAMSSNEHFLGSEYREIELPYGTSSAESVISRQGSESSGESHSDCVQSPAENSDFEQLNRRKRSLKGILIAVSGGVAFGFFSPAFNIAVNDPFNWSNNNIRQYGADDESLQVTRTNLWFSFAFWLASIVGNVLLLRREEQRQPALGTHAIHDIVWTYLKKDPLGERQVAFMAGVVCALGNILQFHGGKMVGYATADLVQAYPLVSTLWDIFLFDEFTNIGLCSRLGGLLITMYITYLAGIILLACSSVM